MPRFLLERCSERSIGLVRVVAGALAASIGFLPLHPVGAGVDEAGPLLTVTSSALDAATTCDEPGENTDELALLVHGTSVTAEENWRWNYARALPIDGWATCTVTLPDRALGDIQHSSEYVVHAIRAAAATSGRSVDVIGISQGGLEVRWALRWWPELRELVDDAIMIATPNHGAVFADVSCLADCPPALWQARTGSTFLEVLNHGDETPGSVDYTSVYSTLDPIVQPATTAPLDGASNVAVQDLCPGRIVEHAQAVYDAAVYEIVLDGLRHPGPADLARAPRASCEELVMPQVGLIDALLGHAAIYALSVTVQLAHSKADAEPGIAAYARVPAGVDPTDPTIAAPATTDATATTSIEPSATGGEHRPPRPVVTESTRTAPEPVAEAAPPRSPTAAPADTPPSGASRALPAGIAATLVAAFVVAAYVLAHRGTLRRRRS